ncbi:hypothetical protein BJ085DRAFT_23300 [Dimargaris cristalligena]|uniref:25S rRNA (uridine-N(3))-methyltransferase BMT5-like domain-containing protein n=1 Tax=Dimargaris cristalligena TaxID=215637 RepID=A0A4P9ZJ76_9FUNG|nr:hypothetical protein BJ085DRAFT_23300 [Dimargaris cristalligena]|eukprot:RKP33286.1 hypothetical protein BJ085DRAFT_23300 [Dimargaris cristalligena]
MNDHILTVGEGNFSFSRAVTDVLHTAHHITATAYDSEEVVQEKYPDAEGHTKEILNRSGTVLYSVDATDLAKYKVLRNQRFTHIIFNFPHTGSGIKDVDINIHGNRSLILGFLKSAIPFLTDPELYPETDLAPGKIHIATKTGLPYDEWRVRDLAVSTRKLVCQTTMPFRAELFPGYEHRRTLGYKEGMSVGGNEEIQKSPAKLYVFVKGNITELRAMNALAKTAKKAQPKNRQKGRALKQTSS